MTLFKGTLFGLGSLAILAVLWRIVVGAFIVGVVVLKIVVFVVVPILLLAWVVNRLLKSAPANPSTGV